MIDINKLIEVELIKDFNLVRETLTRIGLGNIENKVLAPSCVLLHKQGKYYIVHFKEMLMLDGKTTNYCDLDESIKNYIAKKFESLGYIKIKKMSEKPLMSNGSNIIFIKHKDKSNWTINIKYNIGVK